MIYLVCYVISVQNICLIEKRKHAHKVAQSSFTLHSIFFMADGEGGIKASERCDDALEAADGDRTERANTAETNRAAEKKTKNQI